MSGVAQGQESQATFLVERYWPGVTPETLEEAVTRLKEATAEMTGEGMPVRYLGSIYVPGDEVVFCLFSGQSAEIVTRANERAGVQFDRVVESIHMEA